jgi:nicotinamidase-related amidase
MTERNLQLLIIDPQNDFCDLPEPFRPTLADGKRATPSLPVPGAHEDMLRVAELIDTVGAALNRITVTLDAHQRLDIAHPGFWQTAAGGPVAPFTAIAAADVKSGRYLPRLPGSQERVLAYLEQLEARGRYRHMVWPVHCEIGSWGQNVHGALRDAYNGWEERHLRSVSKVTKGENPWTEHYSAIRAEVPDPNDAATLSNTALVAELGRADTLYVAGEAGSHCVKATVEHLVAELPSEAARRLVLVTDCMSPVPGFEAAYQGFLQDMQGRGVRMLSAQDVAAELREHTARPQP